MNRVEGTPIHGDINASAALLGVNGAIIVADGDTATQEGNFFGILALTDIEINTATLDPKIEGTIDGLVLAEGSYLPLYFFSDITLTSGSAVLYKK